MTVTGNNITYDNGWQNVNNKKESYLFGTSITNSSCITKYFEQWAIVYDL